MIAPLRIRALGLALGDATRHRHETGQNNRGPWVDQIEAELGLRGEPWCAVAVQHWLHEAGWKVPRGAFNEAYCPAFVQIAAARKFGLSLVPAGKAGAGDLALFDWDHDRIADHIGFIRRRLPGGVLLTVEGNTQSGNAGSQSDGGGVYRRTRFPNAVMAYVRVQG